MKNKFADDFSFQELLRRRASGSLTTDEASALNQLIAQSPEAAEEALFSEQLSKVLANRDAFYVADMVAEAIATEPSPTASRRWFGWTALGVLAVLFSLSVWGVVEARRHAESVEQAKALAAEFAAPLDNVLFIPRNSSTTESFRAGMDAYGRGQFDEAARFLKSYYAETADPNVGLYLGISFLLNRQPREAVRVLNQARADLDGPGQEAAQWFFALAQLAQGKKQDAVRALQQLPDDGLYSARAGELMKKINQQ